MDKISHNLRLISNLCGLKVPSYTLSIFWEPPAEVVGPPRIPDVDADASPPSKGSFREELRFSAGVDSSGELAELKA